MPGVVAYACWYYVDWWYVWPRRVGFVGVGEWDRCAGVCVGFGCGVGGVLVVEYGGWRDGAARVALRCGVRLGTV